MSGGSRHLTGDRQKLANSEIQHPYLVHLSRMPSSQQGATEDIIAGIRERPKDADKDYRLNRNRQGSARRTGHLAEIRFSLVARR